MLLVSLLNSGIIIVMKATVRSNEAVVE